MISLILFTVLLLIAVFVDVVGRMSSGTISLLAGLALLYVTERLFAGDPSQIWLRGLSILIVCIGMGMRLRAMLSASGTRRDAETQAFALSVLIGSALVMFIAHTETVMAMLPFADEGKHRWEVVFQLLSALVVVLGAVPLMVLDRALAAHPKLMPRNTAKKAVETGLAAAFAVALVVPANWLAAQHLYEYNYAYFKVTEPGSATLNLVASLSEPVECTLFFDPGSDVAASMKPYFDELEAASQGRLVVTWVDQAVDPKLAEDLAVKENGFVVLKMGDNKAEKFRVGTDLEKAKKELKKLDENFQKYLMKVVVGPRTAYLYVGHGEATSKEKDDPFQKLGKFKRLIEALNIKVKTFGAADGSTDTVPDDAALVVITAPEQPFLPEEEAVLEAYVDRGGALLIAIEPGQEQLDPLLAKLGLKGQNAPLGSLTKFLRTQGGGAADRHNLTTNRFGTHEITSILSKNSGEAVIYTSGIEAIEELADPPAGLKRTVLLRTQEGTFADANNDFEQGADEPAANFNFAYAVSGPAINPGTEPGASQETRAIVLGDVSMYSDLMLDSSKANQVFLVESTLWLVGEEDLGGETNNEEDVKIVHTNDDDILMFYGTILGIPLGVLGLGAIITSIRGRKK